MISRKYQLLILVLILAIPVSLAFFLGQVGGQENPEPEKSENVEITQPAEPVVAGSPAVVPQEATPVAPAPESATGGNEQAEPAPAQGARPEGAGPGGRGGRGARPEGMGPGGQGARPEGMGPGGRGAGPGDVTPGQVQGPPDRGPGGFQRPEQPVAPSIPLEDRKIRFNFRNAMWKEVIDFLAEQADLTVWAKSYPQGTFSYREDQYITPDEAIDRLNRYLLLEEFVLIRMDQMLYVHDAGPGSVKPPNIEFIQTVYPENLAKRGSFEIVKCQFALKRTTPEIVQVEINQVLGPMASIVIMPQSQMITITDTVSNLRAIHKIIERLENIDDTTGGTFRNYELKNITAEEAIALMRNLMGLLPEDQTLRVAADAGGKRIWLSGRADRIEKAVEVFTKIDDAHKERAGDWGELQFKAFPVDTADLMTVLAVCQTLLAGKPGIRLQPDPGTNSILAYAYLDDLMVIKNTLASMQMDASGNHVIRLSKMTTSSAATAIEKFFGTASGTSAKAPIVETDATNKCLYVRCTSSQLVQIRSLLATMGETFDAALPERVPGRTIRNINISPSAAELILDQIQQVWPQGRENPIKVVTPSAIVPAMRSEETTPIQQPRTPTLPIDQIDREINRGIDQLFHGGEIELDMTPTNPNTQTPADPGATVYRTVQASRVVSDEERQAALEQFRQEMESRPSQPEGLAPDTLAYLQGVNPNKGAPVVLSLGPNGLILASEDLEALDALEDLIEAMSSEAILTTPIFKPYYLKYLSADSAQTMLNRIMDTSTSSTSQSPVVEDLGTAMLFSVVGSLGPIQSTGPISISTDTRLNALFVKANLVDHYTIEKKLLPLLDVGESPEEIARNAIPRPIKLNHMRVEEAETQVRAVFAQQLQSATGANNRGGQQGGPQGGPQINPEMMQQIIQQMQGGQGGRGGAGGAGRVQEEERMTISAISSTNTLIVNAPEVLFERVKRFVEEIDQAAGERDIVMVTIDVKHTNPQMLQSTLGRIVGSEMITSSGGINQPRGATASVTNGYGSTIQTGISGATGNRIGGGGGGMGAGGFGGFGGGGMGAGGFGGQPQLGGLMNLLGGARPGGTGGGPVMMTNPAGGGMRPGGTTGAGAGGAQQRSFGAPGGGAAGRGGR